MGAGAVGARGSGVCVSTGPCGALGTTRPAHPGARNRALLGVTLTSGLALLERTAQALVQRKLDQRARSTPVCWAADGRRPGPGGCHRLAPWSRLHPAGCACPAAHPHDQCPHRDMPPWSQSALSRSENCVTTDRELGCGKGQGASMSRRRHLIWGEAATSVTSRQCLNHSHTARAHRTTGISPRYVVAAIGAIVFTGLASLRKLSKHWNEGSSSGPPNHGHNNTHRRS